MAANVACEAVEATCVPRSPPFLYVLIFTGTPVIIAKLLSLLTCPNEDSSQLITYSLMPNTKSAAKAMRQSLRRRATNLKTKGKIKNATKQVKKFITDKNVADAAKALRDAMSALDKAVKKGVIHKNTASRRKSRMAKALAKLSK